MILVVDPDRAFHARVAEKITPDSPTVEAATLAEARSALEAQGHLLDVVLLGPGLNVDASIQLATLIRDDYEEISVIFVAVVLTSELLQRVLRAGVKDVLPASFSVKQLATSFGHAHAAAARERERNGRTSAAAATARGTIITLLSAKGGVGKSFIASNLASIYAKEGNSVALVDLDLEFGDLGVLLQLQPTRTIADAVQYPEGLDALALEGYLTPHRSGIQLLAAPPEPGLAETISAEDVQTILRLLADRYQYVIVDTPASFTDHVLAAIDVSDLTPTVTGMEVPSIRNAGLCLRTLEMLGIAREKIPLILNRADSRVGLTVSEVERGLGGTLTGSIPSSRDVPLSVNSGSPIADRDPRSPVTRSLVELAAALRPARTGSTPHVAPLARRRHLGRTR